MVQYNGRAEDGAGMRETLRGVVKPWELDSVEHFTVAYYFKALSSATMRMCTSLGWAAADPAGPWTEYCWARFLKEMRKGDAYHVLTGVIEAGDASVLLGHRLFNSESDEICTTFFQRLRGGATSKFGGELIAWPERVPERRAKATRAAQWVTTSTAMVRPEDLDSTGRLDLTAFIHIASDANVHIQNAIGMTSSYMRENRIGYSTAEYQLEFFSVPPGLGTAINTKSTVAHLGRSSLWFLHEFHDTTQNRNLARLAQFGVHLDMATRRPSPVPDAIRARAQALMGE